MQPDDWRAQRDEALLRLVHDKRPTVRTEAAEWLYELAAADPERAPELSDALTQLLIDTQPEVRCFGLATASALLSPEAAVDVLARGLRDDVTRVRVEAAGRLGDLELPSTRGLLAAAMTDSSFRVRFEAARGLAALGHAAGIEVLIEGLGRPELRFRALGALGSLDDTRAVEPVRRVFERWVLPRFERTQAAAVLARFGDEAGRRHLLARARRRGALDRPMALELLGEARALGALEALLAVVREEGDPDRGAAARGLGHLLEPAARAQLSALLADEGAPEALRVDAAVGLCTSSADGARAELEAALLTLKDATHKRELMQLLSEGS